jgi:uncharacterized protein YjiK
MKTILKILILIVVVALPLIFWGNINTVLKAANAERAQKADDNGDEKSDKKDKKYKEGKKNKEGKAEAISSEIKVINQWNLPSILIEISGLEYLDKNRFACIQDEAGTIFIYDTHQNKITREIPFAGAGDYEGIAIAGTTAYIVRSDGMLYEVSNYEGAKHEVKEYKTLLTDHNVEGLCYDKKNNRLLIAIKDKNPDNENYKGIYAFDLASKKMATTPVIKIDLTDPVFKEVDENKTKNIMRPSEIEINPVTGDIYVTEGTHPKLLIMGADGSTKKLYQMSSSEFQQAEGITFSPQGELYISNEGKNGSGNILKVEIADTQLRPSHP